MRAIRGSLIRSRNLKGILERESNNLDLFRLLAAILDIWGHTYALTPNPQGEDVTLTLTGFEYSGGIAVKFFFISGLLVTTSLLQGSSAKKFFYARFFRVWPALMVCVVLLAGLIGPLTTSLSVDNYFRDSATWQFLFSNSATSPLAGWASSSLTFWNLPGLFTDQPFSEVNGSLWTIPYEVFCYLALFGVWFASGKARRFVTPILVVLLLVTYLIPTWSFLDSSRTILLLSFFLRSSLAIWQKDVYINFWILLPLLLSSRLMVGSEPGQLFFLVTLFLLILWISSLNLVKKLRLPGDYSYGTYLWGWPVQQLVTQLGITSVTIENQLIVIVVSIALGALSWHLVEKPSMKLGKLLTPDLRGEK